MAALLVAMSVMAVLLSVALPTWSQMVRRDKEEELIFRGEQYARAINQYQRKFANQSPSSLDVLIEQRMLRKKFKDPLSPNKDGEFQMLYMSSGTGPQGSGPGMGPQGPGQGTGGRNTGPQGPGGTGGQGRGSGPTGPGGTGPVGGIGPSTSGRGGPIVGVTSKNTGQSIRLYKGKNRYNEWQFIGMEMSPRAGGPGGAGGGGGMPPGGRGPQPGGRGGRGGQDGSDRGGRSGPGTFRPGPDGPNPFGPRSGPTSPPR
jgi:type II secretory pathway pseudopilin PulG